jgi:hypothetical protein
MRSKIALSLLAVSLAMPALADLAPKPAAPAAASKEVARCAHGVKPSVCTRCNPKLAAVFKAKGDWCAEHDRPESQCALCHPELAKQGVK